MIDVFDKKSVIEKVSGFTIDDEELKNLALIRVDSLTPDSASALLLPTQMPDVLYVYYCEDYIESLDKVREVIEAVYSCKVQDFVKPKLPTKFEDSGGARYYVNPDKDKTSRWMQYCVPDGHDYSFLAKIAPTHANDPYWNRIQAFF